MKIMLMFIARYFVFGVQIWIMHKFETREIKVRPEKRGLMVAAAILFITSVMKPETDVAVGIASCFFWGSMVAAAYSDWQIKYAYNFCFFIAFIAGVILVAMEYGIAGEYVVGMEYAALAEPLILPALADDLLVYCLLQALLFRHMYGLADCMGFVVYAVYFAAFGHDLFAYLCFMGVTFILLAVVQIGKRNVNKQGNLKEPVALLPYITVTAVLFLGVV